MKRMADHEDHEEMENKRMEKIEKQVVSYHKGVTWLLHLISKTMSIRCPYAECYMPFSVSPWGHFCPTNIAAHGRIAYGLVRGLQNAEVRKGLGSR
ncbi:hypothetical protein KQX54_000606 [Cotesia glomerata]|uniref:Uncharacterized protein n=1 Tax=Cotesia glomerata TaxID=32391 RepID=A0AAV7HV43_COTGL|nr:hypothetical protein KQX54_000606 [Cotesia glomerata]